MEPASLANRDVVRQPPSGPKVQLLSHAPVAPRAEQRMERITTSDIKPLPNRTPGVDGPLNGGSLAPPTTSSGPKTFAADGLGDPKPNLQTSLQARQAPDSGISRLSGQPPSPLVAARSTSLQLVHPSRREVIEGSGRQDNAGSFPGKQTDRDISLPGQQSPAKIPTGPRAERPAPPIRQVAPPGPRALSSRLSIPQWGRGQTNLTWVRPGLSQGPPQHAPRGPSIMNTVPTKRDNAGEEKIKTPLPEIDDRDPFDSSWPQGETSLKAALDAAKAEGGRPSSVDKRPASVAIEKRPLDWKHAANSEASPRLPFPEEPTKPKSKTAAEDVTLDLDDDDYEAAERNFNREMQMLEAKQPPPLLQHSELLGLLEEIDALASAAEDLANGFVPPIAVEKTPSQMPLMGLPSPKAEDTDDMEKDLEDPGEVHLPSTRQQTPPVESLPFLASGPPTPFSQIDDYQHDVTLQELVKCRIEDQLMAQCEQLADQHEQTRAHFAKCYRTWRIRNLELEEQERARSDATPSPVPENAISAIAGAVPSISGKSIRSIRNTSDNVMETVLKLSEQTAAEEAEKRAHHQPGDRGPNFDKEAIVPDMFNEKESSDFLFEDKNNLMPTNTVLEALAFIPPKDDFSAEEHDKFVNNYILNPKRWGAIAELIAGRTYQDCVQHYYLTKGTCAYKEKEKAFLRIRKGRRGPRGPQNRAKSSNLIPLYDGNPETDLVSTAVTETGRPKRTAAPTFSSTTKDGEATVPASTPLKQNSSRAKVEATGEPSTEKPRRRGGGIMKERGTRKGKALLLAAAPGPSPQKSEKDAVRGRSREPKLEMEQGPEDLEGAQLLAGLQNSHISTTPVSQQSSVETWMNRQPLTMIPTATGPQKPQQAAFEPQLQQQEQRSTQATTSSYWSVPEIQDFQTLLSYFGTNWQAIADTMKTKSVTMVNYPFPLDYLSLGQLNQWCKQVRNYFNRESPKESGDFLKQISQIADEKIKRGDEMGPIPPLTVQTKRRNDATPQIAAQRALAPSVDHVDIDNDSPQTQPSKPVQMSPRQVQTSQPRYPALAQAETTPVAVFSPATSQNAPSNTSRLQQPSQRPAQLQGPRSGFFSDDRSRPILQAQPQVDVHKTPQQQRQAQQEDERIRQHTEALKRVQRQVFLDKLEQQHQVRHAEPASQQPVQHHPRHNDQPQISNHKSSSSRILSTAVSQPFFAPSQPMTSQIRIAPSQPPEIEPRPRFSSQPQQSQLDTIKPEPLTGIRRLDPIIPDQGRQSAIQSPSSGRMPLINSPPAEITRPSSIPGLPPQPPPKPAPAQAKRSNIMSILNDEPSEPAPPRRRPDDVPSVAPKPPPQTLTALTQNYQPPSHSSQQPRPRDHGADTPVHILQPQHRLSMGQSSAQQQQQQQQQQQTQQQQQQQAQAREAPSAWVAAAQRLEQQRASFQSPPVNSPRAQSMYLQQSSRGPFQTIQRSHAPSPPPSSYSHSRTPSYTAALPQHAQQQQMQGQSQQPTSQTQVQAAPNLQPSPYATIRPHQSNSGHQHQQQVAQSQQQARVQQEQMQRQLEEQRHQEMQRRARQEALLQQEAAHQQYQQQQRPQEGPRRQSEQSALLRPKEMGYAGTDRHQERLVQYQESLMRQEQERRQEQTRREQGRVYTPPIYQSHGYGPPPSQQQRGQGPGR